MVLSIVFTPYRKRNKLNYLFMFLTLLFWYRTSRGDFQNRLVRDNDFIVFCKHNYGVRGVSQIKFTISDSFRVFFDFDILSMIKRKTPFDFYCVILIMNLSRLISQMTLLIFKICPFDFSNDTFDFQNLSV